MSDKFANDFIRCPRCPQPSSRAGHKIGPTLVCVARNYSGCSVDIAQCPECGKAWEISYKVADMTRVPSWDGLTRQQQEAAEAEQKERDKLTRKVAFEKLKTEFDPD